MNKLYRAYALLLIVALLASGAIAARRMGVERSNRNVQIVVEWNELRTLAFAASKSPEDYDPGGLLRRFRRVYGVGGLAISEMTLGDLCDAGRTFLDRPTHSSSPWAAARLTVPDPALAAQIVANIAVKRGPGRAVLAPARSGMPAVVLLRDNFELLRSTGVGLPPDAVQAARDSGVDIIGRIANYPGITPAAIDWILARLRRQGARTVIFTGTEVLGNKDLLPAVADSLRRHHLSYGFVEFGKQIGDTALARRMHGNVIRVHSITDAEMAQLTPPEAVERFVKAARERDIRMIYVRLFLRPADDPLLLNGRYLDAIGRNLRRTGLAIGKASPYAALFAGRPLLILAGSGAVAGAVLLLALGLSLAARTQALLLVFGLAASGALLAMEPTVNPARKLLALLAALVFPTLALLRWGNPALAVLTGEPNRFAPYAASTLVKVIGRFLGMACTTLAGALLIVGLLADTRFLLKTDQFAGIKAAHLLPILGLALILAAGITTPASSWRERWSGARASVRRLLSEPVILWQIAGMAVALLFLLFLLLRTGNEPGIGVSSLELRLRSLMDRVLFVRPRTKEFLIGHPAMIVALWAGTIGWRSLWAPALLIGSIGQVSLLNTFCHIHTPLMLSLLRSANGMALGILLGLVAIRLLQPLRPRDPQTPGGSTDGHEPASSKIAASPPPKRREPL